MDILAQKRMLFILNIILLIFGSTAKAADLSALVINSPVKLSYGLSGIDYFCLGCREQPVDKAFSSDELWSEIRLSDNGGIQIYRPPKPVLDFLESPSPENGQKYIAWNAIRLEKIAQAQKMLEHLSKGDL